MLPNKIVMVNDASYVGYELRRELIKRGFNVKHYYFGNLPSEIETFKMAINLKLSKADIVHAHFCRSPAYAALASGKPYIIHCHGTDIRQRRNFLQLLCMKKARKIIVSTPDLLKIVPYAAYLPNPVSERFRPMKNHDGNKVLYFPKWYENITSLLTKLCKKHGYELTIPTSRVSYFKMHVFLNQFDIYVDQFSISSFSKTALEAMACGMPVIGYNRPDLEKTLEIFADVDRRKEIVKWQTQKILPQHNPSLVVQKLIAIYESAML